MLCICLAPSLAIAATTDLGHGAACQHTHNNQCYSQTYHDLGPEVGGEIVDSCPYDKDTAVIEYRQVCNVCGKYTVYDRCSRPSCSYRIEKVSLPTYCSTVLTCSKGTYGDCTMPTISYTLPNQWTNQDVTISYTGSQSGSLTFSDNGTQSITVTSSTGHRIREDITITKIDKIAPSAPSFEIGGLDDAHAQ